MLKNILKFEGVHFLSKKDQSKLLGGIDKCCIIVPTNGFDAIEGDDIKRNCGAERCKSVRCCNGHT